MELEMSSLAIPHSWPIPSIRRRTALFDRVVLAVDFASASLAAGRWATNTIAQRADALLVHVASPSTDEVSGAVESTDDPMLQMVPALSGGLGGFGATLDVHSLSTIVRVGVPSQWLDTIAAESDAALIVLGRRANSARQRIGEPNVLERVSRRTAASVLVVPEGTTRPPDQVVVAVDNGPFAGLVIATAGAIAKLHQIPLIIMHVLAPAIGAYRRVIDAGRRIGRRIGTGLEQTPEHGAMPASAPAWLNELARSHTTPVDRVDIRVGDPAREITSAAVGLGSTLVVVGKRGADGAPARSLGSVARTLLTSAPLPVLGVDESSARIQMLNR
jgi:nucleotide-binding universal stress UspA family protein